MNTEQIYGIYDAEHWWYSSTNQVFEIVGPAGTGKTTMVRFLIEKLGLSYDEVLFVAFMGKAASQLSRNGLPASTIHSAIYNYVKKPVRDENGKIVFNNYGRPKMQFTFELKDRIKKHVKLIVVDEAGTVDKKIALDLLSFGLPVIALGDLNQLPPPFGSPYFLKEPDVKLSQIMRQKEGDPIIWISQQILAGKKVPIGVYGRSSVISRNDITEYHLKHASVILTETNRLRFNVNNFYRERIKNFSNLEFPHYGEKIMCRRNNWGKCIDDGIFLTNGLFGYIDNVDKSSFNGLSLKIDFRPDFTSSFFKDIAIDYKHLYEVPGIDDLESEDNGSENMKRKFLDKFEYAYAQTVHTSQGSQYPNVLYLNEGMMRTKEDRKRIEYTAVTRATDSITIALNE